jgi:hypothetical protein
MQQVLGKHGTANLQQLTYLPDLALLDYFLFPVLKKVLKEHRFEATEDINTIRHSERGVRKMFPTVAETLGEVCSCGRELC